MRDETGDQVREEGVPRRRDDEGVGVVLKPKRGLDFVVFCGLCGVEDLIVSCMFVFVDVVGYIY